MELTKEIKDAKDKYGHPIDFTYCRNCNTFIDFGEREIGYDVQCHNCRTDKYLK
jgi:hypothetical protein